MVNALGCIETMAHEWMHWWWRVEDARKQPFVVLGPAGMSKEEKDVFVLISVMVLASVVITMAITIHTLYVDHTRISRALREPPPSSEAIGSNLRRRSPRLAGAGASAAARPLKSPLRARPSSRPVPAAL